MEKPKMRFDRYRKRWRCQTIMETPGEMCFVSGVSNTMAGAYARWRVLMRIYLKQAEFGL